MVKSIGSQQECAVLLGTSYGNWHELSKVSKL